MDFGLERGDGGRGTFFVGIVFFQLFGGPLLQRCFFSAFLEVYRPWEVAHLFSREISSRMPSESCLGTHF